MPKPTARAFPAALKAARERLDLTQYESAALIGVESNTVARWERGELRPSLPTRRYALGILEETWSKRHARNTSTQSHSGARHATRPRAARNADGC